MRAWKHFRTISRHKIIVMKHCFQVGLYRQGLLHDLSKYSPTEFLVGCRYYQGIQSPNNAERKDKGYSSAWLHHKGRNKHHYEYWMDYSMNPKEGIVGLKMPVRYVVEMFLDRIAASKVYQGNAYTDESPLEYYLRGRERLADVQEGGRMIHPETEALLYRLLTMLAKKGEERTFSYIREKILKSRRSLLQKAYVAKTHPMKVCPIKACVAKTGRVNIRKD